MNLRSTLMAAAAALAFACDSPPPGSTPCSRDDECSDGPRGECTGTSIGREGYCIYHPRHLCDPACGPYGFCDTERDACVALWKPTIVQPHEGDSIGAGVEVVATAEAVQQLPDGGPPPSNPVPAALVLNWWSSQASNSSPLTPDTDGGTVFRGTFTPPASGQYTLQAVVPGVGSSDWVHVTATVP